MATARPIFHLSFPVLDLDEAIGFYVGALGGILGRHEKKWADVALFGVQIRLHHRPGEVSSPMPRSRHFGATLPWSEWERLTASLTDFVEAPHYAHTGTSREQAKAMIRDPSGNMIEIKAYRDPRTVLGVLAQEAG